MTSSGQIDCQVRQAARSRASRWIGRDGLSHPSALRMTIWPDSNSSRWERSALATAAPGGRGRHAAACPSKPSAWSRTNIRWVAPTSSSTRFPGQKLLRTIRAFSSALQRRRDRRFAETSQTSPLDRSLSQSAGEPCPDTTALSRDLINADVGHPFEVTMREPVGHRLIDRSGHCAPSAMEQPRHLLPGQHPRPRRQRHHQGSRHALFAAHHGIDSIRTPAHREQLTRRGAYRSATATPHIGTCRKCRIGRVSRYGAGSWHRPQRGA